MALEVDIDPATGTDHLTSDIEDDLALADHVLRDRLASDDDRGLTWKP